MTPRVSVACVFFITGAAFATWAARVPAVKDRLGLGEGGLAVALAGLTAGALVSLPLMGGLVGRLGSRPVLLLGGALYLGTLPLLAWAPGLPLLTAVLFVFAAGNTAMDVSMNTQGVLVERSYGRPLLGGFHAMFSLGAIAGATGGSAAAAAGLGTGANFLLAALVLAGLLGWSVRGLLADVPGDRDSAPLFALPRRGLWIPGLIALCALMGEGVMNDWGAVYLHEVTGASTGTAAAGFAVFSAGMVAGRLLADRLRGRLGSRRFLLGCAVLAGAGSAGTVALPSPQAGLAGFLLLGLGLAAVVPVVLSGAAGSPGPEGPGPAIAAVSTVGYAGFLAGPPVIGGLAEAVGLRPAMLVLVLLMTAAGALALRLRP